MALLSLLRDHWMISGRGIASLYNHERNALRWRGNSLADRGTVSDMVSEMAFRRSSPGGQARHAWYQMRSLLRYWNLVKLHQRISRRSPVMPSHA